MLQEPELLLGQATPDPEDLPGAHRERPALEHRWTARADCLGQTDPAGPGVGTLGVGTKERPFTHSLASHRRPRLVGPIRHGRPALTGSSRAPTRARGRLLAGSTAVAAAVTTLCMAPLSPIRLASPFLSGQTAGCRAAERSRARWVVDFVGSSPDRDCIADIGHRVCWLLHTGKGAGHAARNRLLKRSSELR